MEGGGKQSRLLSRLLGKLRGDHHKYTALEKTFSLTSSSDSTAYGNMTQDEGNLEITDKPSDTPNPFEPSTSSSPGNVDEQHSDENIDLRCPIILYNEVVRYGGQYLTPEQLPEFCKQLHNLVEIIRNVQSYSKVTGEYPRELERRLELEAQEVAALAAEARNARDVVARTRTQRKAVREHKKQLMSHLAGLKESEVTELESTVRLSDRKLFKNWESLKETNNPSDFDPLLEEIKNKQSALECLVRLIEGRRALINRNSVPSQPLPPPLPFDTKESSAASASNGHKRYDGSRRPNTKRRRKEVTRELRSVPLSGEPSNHGPTPQVTLYIQRSGDTSRNRLSSAGAVAIAPFELPSQGSVRDIVFFTSH